VELHLPLLDPVRLFLLADGSNFDSRFAGLHRVRARSDLQIDIPAPDAQSPKKIPDIFFVVMLAGMDQPVFE